MYRHFVQFRVATLLVLVALAAVSASLWRWQRQQDGYRHRFELHAREEARYAEISLLRRKLVAKLTRTVQDLEASPSKSDPARAARLEMTIRGETEILEGWKAALLESRQEQEYHRERKERYRELLVGRWP